MMTACEDLAVLLEEYLDGSATPAQARRVEEHLDVCPSCRSEIESEERLRHAFSALERPPLPCELAERILAKTVGTAPRAAAPRLLRSLPVGARRARSGRPLAGLAAAAAVAVLALGVWLGPRLVERASARWSPPAPTRSTLAEGSSETAGCAEIARLQARAGLTLAARIVLRTETTTLVGVLGRDIPRAVSSSIQKTARSSEGGEG